LVSDLQPVLQKTGSSSSIMQEVSVMQG